jgi:mono/diheme cytochrome c family protein
MNSDVVTSPQFVHPADVNEPVPRENMHKILLATLAVCFALASPAVAADGAALYAAHCSSCHGADGAADTPVAKAMKAPPVKGASVEAVTRVVRENAKHAAASGKLDDEELAALGAFVSTM